ncbi:hypothetical protein TthAA22_03110 [Thermus thermophilus]|jgi:hypothetical protein|uniref:Uncharacterized protein n=1 Tax=Thermus brockianus TaxID=56956 RepID=A0A1J0LV89_THEBO|nr:hypothetical protein A0O31_01842 [Thermus brockianus]BCZ88506.1 hypothetical protein TthAA22_03110 [Thermus thermophilus]
MGYQRFRPEWVVEPPVAPESRTESEEPHRAVPVRPTGREVRAAWFAAPPRPLPPEVMRKVGAVLEIHGVQGAWNMAGNRLPPEELARLLEALGEGTLPA